MNPEQAVAGVYRGIPVECTAEEWPPIMRALQEAAARWIDQGETLRASIALQEVKLGIQRYSGQTPGETTRKVVLS